MSPCSAPFSSSSFPCSCWSACDGTEPEPGFGYAVWPVTLSPDHFIASLGDRLDVGHVSPPSKIHSDEHWSYYTSGDKLSIVRCARDGFPADLIECDELERHGHIIVGQETADIIYTDFSRCGDGDPPNPSKPFTLNVSSCFGLIRFQVFGDTINLEWGPDDRMGTAANNFKVVGCADTWAAYRLYARSGGGESVVYPLDAVFSDTVCATVTGC